MQTTGTVYEGDFCSKIYKKGVTYHYTVHVPDYDGLCALNVTHDGLNKADVYAMEVLAKRGEAPWCITLGVSRGEVENGMGEGKNRNMRLASYDVVSADFPNFLVEELIPYVTKAYGLKLYAQPDLHMASGTSSGGISAWNMAWTRNDYFRRVYMGSPTFSAMCGGNEYPVVIRKYEPKPIRVFTDFSEHEPDDYFGSSYCAALEGKMALEFAGYDMMSQYHPGEGHSSRANDPESAVERMRFLWKNWETESVVVKNRSTRVRQVLPEGEGWEVTEEGFPEKRRAAALGLYSEAGTYTAAGTAIWFTPVTGCSFRVADGYGHISALAVSADQRRLYIADRDRGCVYSAFLAADGSLEGRFIHGALHHAPDYRYPGAMDLCISACDRIFAATDFGIQSIRAFGLIDVILELPFGKVPEKLEFGETEPDYLYALADGVVYRRRILDGGRPASDAPGQPRYVGYYD